MAPPPWARVCYKTVAVVGGQHVSVYDGTTAYPVGQTVADRLPPSGEEGHGGGLYVCGSIGDCLRHDAAGFPRSSALRGAPRAIARALAWCESRHEEPQRFGHKTAYPYLLRVLEYLPYPASWAARPLDELTFPAAGHAAAGPSAAAAGQGLGLGQGLGQGLAEGRRVGLVAPVHAPTRPQARSDALLRAQTATSELEEDVARMERRLEAMASLR